MTVDVIGNDKIATSHFLLKATANRTLQKLCGGERYNAGECTKYVISAFPLQNNKYHRLPNNWVTENRNTSTMRLSVRMRK